MKWVSRILIVLCLLILFVCFQLFLDNRKLQEEKRASEHEIFDIRVEQIRLQGDLDKLEQQCQLYRNIDERIDSIKDEYFSLALKLENKISNDESNAKIAYLTFDDGPYYLSEEFLNVLEEYDVPATFFSLMKCTETGYAEENDFYDHIYRRILSSGHSLGNHTATHKLGASGVYRSVEAFMDEVVRNREFIENRYGYHTDLMRFPGGSNTSSKAPDIIVELRKIGYGYVDWNSATGDGGANQAPDIFRDNVLDNTGNKKIMVVLMHDYSYNTLVALPEIIEGLQDQGYIFLPLFYDSCMVRK